MSVNFKAMKQNSNKTATIKVTGTYNPRTNSPKAPFLKFNGECTEGGLEANNGEYGTQITVWGNDKKLNPFEYLPGEIDVEDFEAVSTYLKGKTVSFEYYSKTSGTGYLNYFVSSPIEVGELFDEESSEEDTPSKTAPAPVANGASIGQQINLSYDAAQRAHDKESKEPIKGHELLTRMDYYHGFLKPYINMVQNIDLEENQEIITRLLEEAVADESSE